MSRVMVCLGTRPEAIKLAPVVHALRESNHLEPPVVLSTAQHREMLDPILSGFDIKPDWDLGVDRTEPALNHLASQVISLMERPLREERPSLVLVQGDTTSAFMTAMAAFHHGIPVAHLEAGLRTPTLGTPFPEEGNRRLITRLAVLQLAPTPWARDNLLREAVDPSSIVVTGNTVVDALGLALSRPEGADSEAVVAAEGAILVTLHRRESWGEPVSRVCAAIRELALSHEGTRFVVSLHRNPVVRRPIREALDGLPGVMLTEPLNYVEFANALSRCHFVLSDSGGVQEEAPALGKPVVLLRDETERPEGVSAGAVELAGTDTRRIVQACTRLVSSPVHYQKMASVGSLYGDGAASLRVAAACEALLGHGDRIPDFNPPRMV